MNIQDKDFTPFISFTRFTPTRLTRFTDEDYQFLAEYEEQIIEEYENYMNQMERTK